MKGLSQRPGALTKSQKKLSRTRNKGNRNAWRHGFSVGPPLLASEAPEVEDLASAIAGENADPMRKYFAQIAAETEFEARRIRTFRAKELNKMLDYKVKAATKRQYSSSLELPMLARLERYERRVLARRNRALSVL